VVGLHAKDVGSPGMGAAGTGLLDYDLVASLHATLPRQVPVIAQDLTPEQAPAVHAFLARHWPSRQGDAT
jgi:hypothetical protein